MSHHSRRRILQGLGGLAMALPWLELFENEAWAQTSPTRPKRVIVVTYQMGIPVAMWKPSAVGNTFTLPYVTAPLEPFKSRCLFVSDLDNAMLSEGGSSFEFGHPGKSEAALTGTLTTGAFPTTNTNSVSEIRSDLTTNGGANAESIEQRIGTSLFAAHPFASVDLGIDGDRGQGKVPSRFCFESRATAVSLECNPTTAFNRLFANVTPGNMQAEQAMRELKARNKSVLDAVRGEFGDLRKGLGADDQRRLDEHAARIRTIELTTVPPPTCARPTGINALTMPRMDQATPPQVKILAQAMACNLAPVGRLEFANQQSPRFGIASLDNTLNANTTSYDWHAMVHGDPLPGTTQFLRPGRDANATTFDTRLLDGYRFFVQQFAALLGELDSFPEGQGTTVLDNSLVILATDFGEGLGHYHAKMGYVLAGNLGAAKKGFHFRAGAANANFYTASQFNVSQLLNSVLDMAGVVGGPEFGLKGFLAKRAAPRRIDGLFV